MLPESKTLGQYVAITQVALELVLPALAGYGLDVWIGWGPWGLITGAVLGLGLGLVHLIHIANKAERAKDQKPDPDPTQETDGTGNGP